jgi:hypothetical protein
MNKKLFYWLGVIFIPIGMILVGLGIESLFLKECCYQFSVTGLRIGLGTGLIIDGIIFLRTYRYLNANNDTEL